jgi:hypothetical protein
LAMFASHVMGWGGLFRDQQYGCVAVVWHVLAAACTATFTFEQHAAES